MEISKERMENNLRILVVGIGNEYRGDDGVGLYIARKLKEKNLPNVEVVERSGEATELIDCWKEYDKVILVDALCCSNTSPGTIYRWDAQTQLLPKHFSPYSTHAFGVVEAIELAKAMNQLPSLVIYGVVGKNFGTGIEPALDRGVEEASQEVVERIFLEVERLLLGTSSLKKD